MKNSAAAFIALCVGIFVFSCKVKEEKNKEGGKEIVTDTINYYPVNFFLNEDMRKVLNAKAKIYKTVKINQVEGKPVEIDTAEFHSLANLFFEKDITQANIKRYYKESVFRSLSTQSVTMNYTSINPDLPVKTVDANLSEDSTHSLMRVDIRVIASRNDSTFTENYSWLPGKKFYITRFVQGKDMKSVSTITTVTWKQ